MRVGVILSLALAAGLGLPVAGAQTPAPAAPPAAAPPAATAPEAPVEPAEAPASRYAGPMDALIAADLDHLIGEARTRFAGGQHDAASGILVFLGDLSNNRVRDARTTLAAMPGGLEGDAADLFEPFLLNVEGRAPRALERVQHNTDSLPFPMPELARALILESSNQLPQAATLYGEIERQLDTRPPPQGEPQNMEDVTRSLQANRTMNALYRAALVNQRLGRTAEARRLYGLVSAFSPHSADVDMNLARLERSQPPYEAALTPQTALGRWLIFLSDHLGQTEGLMAIMTADGPIEGLASPAAAMFLQFGLRFDPGAEDWRIFAADQLIDAEGYDGAQRLLAPIQSSSPFYAEAELTRARVYLGRNQDAQAIAAADRALAANSQRWGVVTSAGDVYRTAGRPQQAVSAFDRALVMASNNEERADVLRYRSYAHRFAGDLPRAVADARAALALDRSDDTRITYVSILMDDPASWRDGISVARELFAERPDSVSRLNTLGYALIQRPEGLEEGFRLLWRGFVLGERDYAVIDSLGWAYYQYGAFSEALALIDRAHGLTGADENAEILDHYGDVLWRLNRRDEARQRWQQALAARPDTLRRAELERKVRDGLRTPAPTRRTLPEVTMPSGQRDDT